MSRRLVLVWALVALMGSTSSAQMPFARDLVPKRESLSRLGLERQWMAVVPLSGDERMMSLSMYEGMTFARTNKGFFHAFDAESGQLLWSARLGTITAKAFPSSVNSFAVFATNLNTLYALDRKTGKIFWTKELIALPSTPTACDEERVMVGLANGKLYGFGLKEKNTREGTSKISDHAIDVWNWQTSATMDTRPLPAGKLVVFGSDDGKVYVGMADERTLLWRFLTGGAIGDGFGKHGTRLLLIPSADKNLYGVDVLTSKTLWTFPSGASVVQEPLVAGDDIFVVNTGGLLSSIDAKTGSPHWTTSTLGGQLAAVSAKKIYLESNDGDLFTVDRATGKVLSRPEATLNRVGLNLRNYTFGFTNRENDRLYFATDSGLIVVLREAGQTKPQLLRDPKALPFAYIPPEGIDLSPKPAAAPGEGEPSSPPADTPGTAPDADAPK